MMPHLTASISLNVSADLVRRQIASMTPEQMSDCAACLGMQTRADEVQINFKAAEAFMADQRVRCL